MHQKALQMQGIKDAQSQSNMPPQLLRSLGHNKGCSVQTENISLGTTIYDLLASLVILKRDLGKCFSCSTSHPLIWAATWQNQQNECAPSEDSDQPGHLPSLIRVFAVRMKKPWATHWVHSEDSDQTGQMPRLIWVFAGRTLTLLVLSCCGSIAFAGLENF